MNNDNTNPRTPIVDGAAHAWVVNNPRFPLDPDVANRIIDVRYSVVPNEIEALWAIDLVEDRAADAHVDWRPLRRTTAEQTSKWWAMLFE